MAQLAIPGIPKSTLQLEGNGLEGQVCLKCTDHQGDANTHFIFEVQIYYRTPSLNYWSEIVLIESAIDEAWIDIIPGSTMKCVCKAYTDSDDLISYSSVFYWSNTAARMTSISLSEKTTNTLSVNVNWARTYNFNGESQASASYINKTHIYYRTGTGAWSTIVFDHDAFVSEVSVEIPGLTASTSYDFFAIGETYDDTGIGGDIAQVFPTPEDFFDDTYSISIGETNSLIATETTFNAIASFAFFGVGSTTFGLSWTPVTNAVFYDIYIDDVLVRTLDNPSTTYGGVEIAGVQPKVASGRIVEVVVKAGTTAGIVSHITEKTNIQMANLAPLGFTATGHTDSVTLGWNTVADAVKYEVLYFYDGRYNVQETVVAPTTTFLWNGLNVNTYYPVAIIAYNVSNEPIAESRMLTPVTLGGSGSFSASPLTKDGYMYTSDLHFGVTPIPTGTSYSVKVNGYEIVAEWDRYYENTATLSIQPGAFAVVTVSEVTDPAVQGDPLIYTEYITQFFQAPPEANNYFYTENYTTTSLTLVLNSSNGGEKFQFYKDDIVYGSEINILNHVDGSVGEWATYSIEIANLEADTDYYMSVVTINDAGRSSRSNNFKINLADGIPPTGLIANETNSTSTLLSWDVQTGVIAYAIYQNGELVGKDNDPWTNNEYYIYDTFLQITDLDPNNVYNFTVVGIRETNETMQSAPVEVSTYLTSPTNLITSNQGTTTIDLAWDAVLGATDYDIYKNGTLIDTVHDINNVHLTGLAFDGIVFVLTVVATNGNNFSLPSEGLLLPETSQDFVLTTSTIGDTEVGLSWTHTPANSANGSFKIYKIEEDITLVDTVAGDILTYNITSLNLNTNYHFILQSYDNSGNLILTSNSVNFSTIPASPMNFAVTQGTNKYQIDLTFTWDAVAGNAPVTYQMYEVTYPSGVRTFTPYEDATDKTKVIVINVNKATTFKFAIETLNSFGVSEKSADITFTSPPYYPTNPRVENSTATGFTLRWFEDQANTNTLASVYLDDNLNSQGTIDYNVDLGYGFDKGKNVTGLGLGEKYVATITSDVMVDTTLLQSALSAPPITGYTLTTPPTIIEVSDITASSLKLIWGTVENASTYQIYKDGIEFGSPVAEEYGIVTDLNFTPGSGTILTVSAINPVNGISTQSASLDVSSITIPDTPTTPTFSIPTDESFSINWNTATNATAYRVYKDGEVYENVLTGTTLNIINLIGNTNYNITISAINDNGTLIVESEQSPILVAMTAPIAPTLLQIDAISETSITVSWVASPGNNIKYQVYKQINEESIVLYNHVPITGLTLTIPNLLSGTNYNITVKALNINEARSTASNIANTITLPSKPLNLNADPVLATAFTLSWNSVVGAVSYQVYDGVTPYDLPQGATSLDITERSPESHSIMTVVAINANGQESTASDSLDVLTPSEIETIGSLFYYYNGTTEIPLYDTQLTPPYCTVELATETSYIELVATNDSNASGLLFHVNGQTLAAKKL